MLHPQPTGRIREILSVADGETQSIREKQLQLMACNFWKSIDSYYKGAIPAGLVFVPGRRISQKGFGWAPKTFMAPNALCDPDPFYLLQQQYTDLTELGLIISCPGILLHPEKSHRKKLLLSNNGIGFDLPLDPGSVERYHIDIDHQDQLDENLTGIAESRSQLAIIMPRLPATETPERCLLTEIYKPDSEPDKLIRMPGSNIHFVHIRFAIWVRRPENKSYDPSENIIISARTDSKQKWCVDGPELVRFNRDTQERISQVDSQGTSGRFDKPGCVSH